MDAKTERKIAVVLGAAMVAYGFWNAKKVKRNRQKILKIEKEKQAGKKYYIQKVPSATERIVDHPVVPWLLQNGSVVLIALIGRKVYHLITGGATKLTLMQGYLAAVLGGIVSNELHMVSLSLPFCP